MKRQARDKEYECVKKHLNWDFCLLLISKAETVWGEEEEY